MKTPPHISHWALHWKNPFSAISTTLYFLAIVILILFALIAWRSWSDYRLLDEKVALNQLSANLRTASDQLAAERGFATAAINASASEREKFLAEVEKYRKSGDAILLDVMSWLQAQQERHAENIIIDLGLLHLKEAKRHIIELRERVDRHVGGNSAEITTEVWFSGISDAIGHEQHAHELIMANQLTHRSIDGYVAIKNWAWSISENVGRVRALLTPYLINKQPIPDFVSFELDSYQRQAEHGLEMLHKLDSIGYVDKRVIDALGKMRDSLSGDFSDIRTRIYKDAAHGNYEVNAEQWLGSATQTIESVLSFSELCSEIVKERINEEKEQKLHTIVQLLLITFVTIFLVAISIRKTRGAAKNLIEAKRTAEESTAELRTEVTWRKSVEEKLRLSEQSFLMLVMKSPVGIVVTGSDGACLFINAVAEKMLNQQKSEPLTNKALSLARLGSRLEIDIHREDHLWGTAEADINETVWGNKKQRLILLHDITSRKNVENEIVHMAYHDNLTGLANRTLFRSRIEHAINRARQKNTIVAILFVDIDGFNVINDTLGHAIGDELLGRIAGKLLTCVDDGDTVGRIGGDDFAVLLEDVQTPEAADACAQRIQNALSEKIPIRGHFINVSACIGISMYPRDADAPDLLMQSASSATFHAKEKGRGSILHFNPRMGERFTHRLELESHLHQAVKKREFEIYYQPMVSARSKRIIGAEALLRWKHPQLGAVSPDTFIPALEEMGLIIDLGRWVIENVCEQNKAWQESGLSHIVTSVNLSPLQLVLESLTQDLRKILADSRLSPEYLELEVTETALMQSPETCAMILQQIMAMGINIAIDDFGTGYSSLSHLRSLPINKLKIDRSFVMDIPHDEGDMSITQAIISLAHNLKLDVIAEGVETSVQLDFLGENGCEKMQGFYFSQPLTAIQFEALLNEQAKDDELPNRRLSML
ncbi:putative bifunctional diguanylate cyclase/phosphodiesterase [Sedimenticola selenatireducens]|uniref:cyclic-guanylate-specific phosphodiesterase n=1 Tax=Sedimenticola selenatireducens TaxID=191960 RepID=A0A557RV40_9GAMM|nr:EAL domain-containing protein [Sedimenticola selenatireducens]TVO69017.1 EAL domain-containing protein [Sedimenticola selenatireducens]TVT60901.1 MAG: EAL domain-containing protein [Sedimenticola selenatireducens]